MIFQLNAATILNCSHSYLAALIIIYPVVNLEITNFHPTKPTSRSKTCLVCFSEHLLLHFCALADHAAHVLKLFPNKTSKYLEPAKAMKLKL